MIEVYYEDSKVDIQDIKKGNEYTLKYPCYDNNCNPYTVYFNKGIYLIELWGASGSNLNNEYGHGAYTSGIITLHRSDTFYFYIGNVGEKNRQKTYNGGGAGSGTGYSGGGSTDMRIIKSNDNNNPLEFKSLLSRIMVAAGGAGFNAYDICDETPMIDDGFGHGGEGTGSNGNHKKCSYGKNVTIATAATQKQGGKSSYNEDIDSIYSSCINLTLYGKIGEGASAPDANYGSGGGGGYFGGGAGCVNSYAVTSGSGGSSYVSGHPSCIEIDEKSTNNDNIIFLDSSIHYSTYFFHRPFMVNGGTTILEPNRQPSVGHIGSGFVKITILELSKCSEPKELRLSLFVLIILF